MGTTARRRAAPLLLGLALLPPVVTAPERPKTVRPLTAGHSFSQNATESLARIVAADGNAPVHHRRVIGGGGPDQHLAKVAARENDPTGKAGPYNTGQSLKQELAAGKWDVIAVRQASIKSHDVSPYRPGMRERYAFVKAHAPASEVATHQTWAYRVDAPRFGGQAEPRTQKTKYDGLADADRTIAKELGVRSIPVGDAFSAADTDPTWGYKPDSKFDVKAATHPALPDQTHSLHVGWRWAADKPALTMDGHHAGPADEYLGGLVFDEFLYGRSAVGNTCRPSGVDGDYARFLQATAHQAVE